MQNPAMQNATNNATVSAIINPAVVSIPARNDNLAEHEKTHKTEKITTNNYQVSHMSLLNLSSEEYENILYVYKSLEQPHGMAVSYNEVIGSVTTSLSSCYNLYSVTLADLISAVAKLDILVLTANERDQKLASHYKNLRKILADILCQRTTHKI